MLTNLKPRTIAAFVLVAALLIGVMDVRLAAQTTAGTILGTVTDASGGAVPDAAVLVTNTGTNASQSTQSDAEGRYRVPALPVGQYDIQSEKAGFKSVIHKGITLTVGADVVVDFELPVGQVAQTVVVDSNVSQVETTSSAISNLVEPAQMRELPLNGRNFEQLILLSPGVTINQSIGYTAVNGFGNAYSVSGSRTRGQWEILDGNDVMDYQGRGSGSGVLGTQLGVDAIAEFQVLTNTYSAQYGGNGAVVNSVTRSGTNILHGSVYEFIRNSALDARNYFDPPKIPLFQKNQFGGTLGGPIKKDKMFFFANYEGIRQNTGVNYPFILPDAAAHNGYVPTNGVYSCVNKPSIPYDNSAANNAACAATIPAPIQTLMNFFPPPSNYPYTVNLDSGGKPNGLITSQETAASPGSENYLVVRYDWTISTKDSFFTRYLYDGGNLFEPFVGATLSPADPKSSGSQDRSLNQYLAIEEKHIWSSNVVNSVHVGFTRTLNGAASGTGYDAFRFGQPDLWKNFPAFPSGPQGSISILPLVNPNITRASLGGATAFRNIQNKYQGAEDIFWNKGAHSLQFGASIQRVQSYGVTPPVPGTWTFANMTTFLTMAPSSGSAVCNSSLWSACNALPLQSTLEHWAESDFGFYLQDNWRVRSTVTLNIGLRYSPATNPRAIGGLAREYVNMPFSPSYNPALPMPGCITALASSCPATVAAGTLPSTLVQRAYLNNPSFHNFEPRIGIAWDPFKDHKTSVRAGYGIFRSPILPYDYTSYTASPYSSLTSQCPTAAACNTFPLPPFSAGAAGALPPFGGGGIDPGNESTPYMQQYNLTVQRQLARNTTLSVGYVGSHGIHLLGNIDENPSLPTGVPGAITVPAGKVVLPYPAVGQFLTGGTASSPISASGQAIVDPTTGQMSYSNVMCNAGTLTSCSVVANNHIDPTLDISAMKRTTFWSTYNSLQVNLARRLTNNLQFQTAYTWASCLTNSSGTTAFENGELVENSWNPNLDKGNCGFYIRHTLSTNGMYILPFGKNRLVSGWQIGGILQYHTGGVMDMTVGWPSEIINARSGPLPPRVNLVPGCKQLLKTINQWVNPNCYTMPPIGEPGNAPYMGTFGPDSTTVDGSLTKNTRISERYNVQFRAEVFNLLNHPNFRTPGQPVTPVFQQASPLPASCATTPSTCSNVLGTVGQVILTNTSSRQIQFGLKLTF